MRQRQEWDGWVAENEYHLLAEDVVFDLYRRLKAEVIMDKFDIVVSTADLGEDDDAQG